MPSCLSSHKQKPSEVNTVPYSWMNKLFHQSLLFIAKVSVHCFLSLILSVVKNYILFFLPTNATEIRLPGRMPSFQNISTKAIAYLTFQINMLVLKIFSGKLLLITSSHFNWEVCGSILTLFVYGFCFVLLSRLQHIFTQCQLTLTKKQQVVHSVKTGLQIFLLYIHFSLFFRFNFNFYQDRELLLYVVILVINRIWRSEVF